MKEKDTNRRIIKSLANSRTIKTDREREKVDEEVVRAKETGNREI